MDNRQLAMRNRSMIGRTRSRRCDQNMKTLGITKSPYNERGERRRERYQKVTERERKRYEKARRNGMRSRGVERVRRKRRRR